MACVALHTGTAFLTTTLAHIDCQGQAIGAYGYGALADPGSSVFVALTGLLTIFIALFGIRLMLGHPVGGRDVIGEVIKIGLVLTLATSWPAWRVVGYDLVLDGPDEIARDIGLASGLPGGGSALVERLQNVDDGLVAITMYGTGRLTGGVIGGSDLGDSFHGVALADQTGFGWGRVAFLTAIIAPYATTRIGAGLLLSLAPLMAGLLFFTQTSAIFVGWLRGLVFVALASLALSISAGVEVALLAPWVSDVLSQREVNTFAPSAPTELMVLTSAFALFNLGMLALTARIAFMPGASFQRLWAPQGAERGVPAVTRDSPRLAPEALIPHDQHSRAQVIADAVAVTLQRESAGGALAYQQRAIGIDPNRQTTPAQGQQPSTQAHEPLGSSYRRNHRRASAASVKRDRPA